MKSEDIDFDLVLGNGEKGRVRYCDKWGSPFFGKRTIHSEFRDGLSTPKTMHRSEFRTVGENEKVDPEKAAREIIEELTGIKFSGVNVQQKL